VPDGLVFGLGPIAEERIERAVKQVARLIE